MARPVIDLTGRRFGRWTVIGPAMRTASNHPKWICRCDCGAEGEVWGGSLRGGESTSCGCYAREVTSARRRAVPRIVRRKTQRTYRIWQSIKWRCKNSKDETYFGIPICDRWQEYENFLADMGECPSPKHSIDRIKNENGYEPGNCRWATMKTQQNNRSNNRRITFNGQTKTAAEWQDATGIKSNTISMRLKRGWSVEDALTFWPS